MQGLGLQPGLWPLSCTVDETVDRLFLDIWGRQFVKVDGGKAPQADSAAFHCLVRVPGSALSHLHKLNVAGFYCEPRAAGGNGPHPGFAVIWLPGTDRAKALHALRTCSQAVSLARLGTKYGLRVREADEQKVFEAYRPGQEFVQVKVTSHYKLFPLPFGFQRKNVTQALRNWQWCAKPLQPVKGNSQGCAWLVGSSSDPLCLRCRWEINTFWSIRSGTLPPQVHPPVLLPVRGLAGPFCMMMGRTPICKQMLTHGLTAWPAASSLREDGFCVYGRHKTSAASIRGDSWCQ